MLREEIIKACQNITTAITKSGFKDLLEGIGRGPTDFPKTVKKALHCYVEYNVFASKFFGPSEAKLLKIFKLGYLEDKMWWEMILGKDEDGAPEAIRRLYSTIPFASEYLPVFMEIIKIDLGQSMDVASKLFESKDVALQEIILIEDEEKLSSLGRFINSFDAIRLLYEVSAKLVGIPPSDISVVSFDSGSDKSFKFIGNAKAIKKIKNPNNRFIQKNNASPRSAIR